MSIIRRANESSSSQWREVPEGMWRWRVSETKFEYQEKWERYRVQFTLTLTEDEQQRLLEEHGEPDGEVKQSNRVQYGVGWSLGWIKDNQYQTTKLVDFLAACFGSRNAKPFRKWIADGGGPKSGATEAEEVENVRDWLEWVKDLEVYGTVRLEADKSDAKKFWPRFGGPLPVGSIPGQPEPDYQALGLGKLRAMMLQAGETPAASTAPTPMPQVEAIPAKQPTPEDVFDFDADEEAAPTAAAA